MKLFNFNNKVKRTVTSIKSFFPFFGESFTGGSGAVPITQSFIFYETVSPFYHAINKIADEIKTIKPIIVNVKTGDIIPDYPILKLLNNPNSNVTYSEFAKRCITHYLVSGNLYLRVKALNENQPPVSIDSIDPRSVTLTQSSTIDQYPWRYNVTMTNDAETFLRNSDFDFHYYNKIKTQELCQIKDFCVTTDNLYGMPRTAPLFLDLEQFATASRYNLAVLKNGGRLSTVYFNRGENLDVKDREKLQQDNQTTLSGASNGGRSIVLEGDWDVKEFGVTNKDMDFLKQKEHVAQNIYGLFEIPLPLVMTSTMTMGNYENAIAAFYDNAVLPTVDMFFERLSKFLLRRYKNSEDLAITFDPFSLSALESRRLDQLEKRGKLKVESINEMRTLMNLAPLKTGGDAIYDSSMTAPIAYTEEYIPPVEIEIIDNEKKLDLSHFKNSDGEPLFTDHDLKGFKNKHGL